MSETPRVADMNARRRAGAAIAMLALGLFLLAFSFAGVGAGSPGQSDSTFVKRGGTLRLAGSGMGSPDTALAYGDPLVSPTCAMLFAYPDAAGSAGARVIPEVVQTYGVSDNGRSYTFELKRSFRFHTGRRVTARSFADAFDRVANPRMQSPLLSLGYLDEIVGAKAVLAGKATSISGVRVLDRYRLQMRLTKPLPDLLGRLTMGFFCPIPPNTPIDPRGIDRPAGSGPYYVADWIPNNRLVLERNPYYPRGERSANVDRIIYRVMDSEACLLATERDEIDLCLDPGWSGETWNRLAQKYGVNKGRLFVTPRLATSFIVLNHDRRAFRGPGQIPLAKAINYAIDRPALVRAYRNYGPGRPTDQMLPPPLGTNERIYPLAGADPSKARKWLRKARYKPRRLVLYWPNFNPDAAESVRLDLKRIGIEVVVRLFGPREHFTRIGSRGEPFDLAYVGWLPDYIDGGAFLAPLASGTNLRKEGSSNASYFNDPRVNARIRAAGLERGAARRDAWADLDVDLMRDNPPWAPFMHFLHRVFVSKSFGCYVDRFGSVDLVAACKK